MSSLILPLHPAGHRLTWELSRRYRGTFPSTAVTMERDAGDVTLLLAQMRRGVPEAEAELFGLVYAELRKLAAIQLQNERANHTLQPTALVSEVYLRLMAAQNASISDRTHFFALASRVMRRVLVDHARRRSAQKRGGGLPRESIDHIGSGAASRLEDLLTVDVALEKLAAWDARQARIVEMRFFGGLKDEEIAEALGISLRSVQREWAVAKAWLRSQMQD